MKPRATIILLSCLIILFLLLTWAVAVQNPFVISIDQTVFQAIPNLRTTPLNSFMLAITNSGDVLGAGIIFSLFAFFLFSKKQMHMLYVFILACMLGTFLPEIIKFIVMRPRPISPFILETDPSFPSSHATIAAVFLFTSLVFIAPLIKQCIMRVSFKTFAVIFFPLIALSRIYLSIHWTSDVVAGALLGCICFIIAELSIKLHNDVYPLPEKQKYAIKEA